MDLSLSFQPNSQFYTPLILKWLQSTYTHPQLSYDKHYQQFLKTIYKIKGINILFDTSVVSQIHILMKSIQFYRFAKDMKQYNQQKGYRLAKILHFLVTKKFAKEKAKQKIINFINQYNLQVKIERLLQTVKTKKFIISQQPIQKNQKIKKINEMLKQQWDQEIPFKFQDFWIHFHDRKERNHQKVKQTRKIYEHLKIVSSSYSIKISQKNQNVCTVKLKNINPIFKLSKNLNELVYNIVLNNDLSHDKYSLNQITKQINLVKKQIMNIKSYNIIEIQQYGSIRSKLALRYRSDADLTVITQKQLTQRQNKDILFRIKEIVQSKLPYKKSLVLHQNVKVKTVMLKSQQFSRDSYSVDKIDVVINNYHGINNSRLLQKFSTNTQIRNFLLLVKLWGKRNFLITIRDFSSYGMTLMGLFYLMSTDQIEFLQNPINNYEEKDCLLPKIIFNEKKILDLQKNFIQFLKFYSSEGLYFEKNLFVNLVRNSQCRIDQRFLINMVDPMDKTNPGRYKKLNKETFFGIINSSLQKIQLGDPEEVAGMFISNPLK